MIEYLGQHQMYLGDQRTDQKRYRGDKHCQPQAICIAQSSDRALSVCRLVFPRKPTVNAHPAKIHLQEHVRIKVYLKKNNKEEYRVQYPSRPCKDICSRRQKNRDQAKQRSDKLNIADLVFKNRKESLFN